VTTPCSEENCWPVASRVESIALLGCPATRSDRYPTESCSSAGRGDLPGIPATGNEMLMTATVIHCIENGRLAEKWSDADVLAMLQQLEVIPPLN
jgi:hypothetical protein